MHQWFVPDDGNTVLQALDSKSIPYERIEVTEQTVLFAVGDKNNSVYIVLDSIGEGPPVVLDSFTGNPFASVELEKDGVLGTQLC